MFKLRWPFKRKVRSDCGRPDLDENNKRKITEPQHTAKSSGGQQQQPIAVHPFLNRPEGYLQPLPVIRHDEIMKRCIRTTIVDDVSFSPTDLDLVKALLRQGFVFEFCVWDDSSACTFAFAPGTHIREIAPATMILGYALGRTMLEAFFIHTREQITGHGRLQ